MSRTASPRIWKAGMLAAAVGAGALTTFSAAPAGAVTGDAAADGAYAYTARLDIGNNVRACTGALVDRNWIITAASCFADNPAQPTALAAGAPKWKTTATIGRTDLTTTAGKTADIVELVPRQDRDLVMARLATPVDGIAPLTLATTTPAAGESLRVASYGRTTTDWAPVKLHSGLFTLNTVKPTAVDTTGVNGAAVCKGDTGAPTIRETNGRAELVAVASLSWQGGCLGTPATETRTGATSTRTDDVAGWVQQVRATALGWKTQALVKGDTGLYQATRLYDGSWTPFEDVQAKAGSTGGVRVASTAGINGDTHIVTLGGDGRLHHAIHRLDGTWQPFGDVNTVAGNLNDITQVATASVGGDLHVVVVAEGGQVFHTVRLANGTWAGFGPVFGATGPLSGITTVAAAGVGNDLHVAAVADGKLYHTRRTGDGTWSGWGAVASEAGATGPVTSVAMARQGDAVNVAVLTDNGANQYHTIWFPNQTWQPFRSLSGVLGQVTATSISAAPVDQDVQFAVVTNDNRVLTTARLADGGWNPATALNLQGITGNHTGTALTGTL
ncbi:trypsin-like serine protease [Kitasatospora sp. NPDC092286]|uniref:trypsin-like serine protease n=1 Tax=Kitasatospora sp. NPDC092286 TaxID=3364087 RepID=UPI0038193156